MENKQLMAMTTAYSGGVGGQPDIIQDLRRRLQRHNFKPGSYKSDYLTTSKKNEFDPSAGTHTNKEHK